MSFARQITNRNAAPEADAVTASRPASSAAIRTAQVKPRAWGEQFYREAERTGLPLAKLNAIAAECETYPAAMAKVAEALAAGQGHAALRPAARADVARSIAASHAKAHQPRNGANRSGTQPAALGHGTKGGRA